MRKIDYLHLADIIERELACARTECPDAVPFLEHVARSFSEKANVDRAAFLEACGIE